MESILKRLKLRSLKHAAISSALSIGLVASGAGLMSPTIANAATAYARQTRDCSSKVVGFTEYTGCLTANDWYDGTHVATNWDSTSCNSAWWAGFFCADQHSGHYWNGYANVDWGCTTVMEYLAFGSETYSVHLNIYTRANGYTWYSNWINVYGGC